jgi:hypothetical protein
MQVREKGQHAKFAHTVCCVSQNTSQYAVVVAVEGMNHWQFASGPAPANVRSHDLLPTIADSEAQRSAAMVSGT